MSIIWITSWLIYVNKQYTPHSSNCSTRLLTMINKRSCLFLFICLFFRTDTGAHHHSTQPRATSLYPCLSSAAEYRMVKMWCCRTMWAAMHKEAGGGAWMLTSTTARSHWLSMTSLKEGAAKRVKGVSLPFLLSLTHRQYEVQVKKGADFFRALSGLPNWTAAEKGRIPKLHLNSETPSLPRRVLSEQKGFEGICFCPGCSQRN